MKLQPPNNLKDYNLVVMELPGDWVRKKRKGKGMRQEDVATRAGVSVSYISTIERGQKHSTTNAELRPEPDKVRAIAKAVGGDPDELLVLYGYAPDTPIVKKPRTVSELLEALEAIGMPGLFFAQDKLQDAPPEEIEAIFEDIQLTLALRLRKYEPDPR